MLRIVIRIRLYRRITTLLIELSKLIILVCDDAVQLLSQRLRDLAEFNKAAALELDVRLLQIFINGSAKVVRSWRENEFVPPTQDIA
jgi:hypothetical protein